MTTSNYVQRRLQVIFELGQGTFGTSGKANTVTLDGLRVSASVVLSGGIGFGHMNLRIWGMKPDDQEKLFTLGQLYMFDKRRNYVTLKAGDVGGNLSTVYRGTIQDGYFDGADLPRACFYVLAHVRGLDAVKPADAITLTGPVDVAAAMKDLAGKLDEPADFKNNGVDMKLPDTYLPGTITEKIQRLANAAGIPYFLDGTTLAIWPKGGTRKSSTMVVSPSTGMVGYPSFTQYGVLVTTLYDPRLKFGAAVKIESSLKSASRTWGIFNLTHELESEMPNGNWVTRFQATVPEYVTAAAVAASGGTS